jgi:hypothetical protein
MYIKYTFNVARLLVHQVLRAVTLPVTCPLAVETLTTSSLGLLGGSNHMLATLLKVSLLSLCLLDASHLIDHQHLMLFLNVYFLSFQLRKKIRDRLLLEAFVARRERL